LLLKAAIAVKTFWGQDGKQHEQGTEPKVKPTMSVVTKRASDGRNVPVFSWANAWSMIAGGRSVCFRFVFRLPAEPADAAPNIPIARGCDNERKRHGKEKIDKGKRRNCAQNIRGPRRRFGGRANTKRKQTEASRLQSSTRRSPKKYRDMCAHRCRFVTTLIVGLTLWLGPLFVLLAVLGPKTSSRNLPPSTARWPW